MDYATSDGTGERPATAGEDYTATSGTLTFEAGETSKTISVPVLDDSYDEGQETMLLTLSNPQGNHAWLADATAIGTIENSDQMPGAWAVRFGRTVGGLHVEALTRRLESGASRSVVVGGIDLLSQGNPDEIRTTPRPEPGWDDRSRIDAETKTMTLAEFMQQSAFHVSHPARGDATLTAWGQFATERFTGEEDDLTLDGDVTTGILGADAALGPTHRRTHAVALDRRGRVRVPKRLRKRREHPDGALPLPRGEAQ